MSFPPVGSRLLEADAGKISGVWLVACLLPLLGACAWLACATMRASGCSLRRLAWLARISTTAAAPSEIEDEFAGVTVPPSRKTGFKVEILARSAVNGCSSRATSVAPLRDLTATGTISLANEPSSLAVLARFRLVTAKSSCAARVNWYFSAVSSA